MFSATTFDKCLLELNFNKPNYFCFSWTILILCTVSPSKPQNQANADLLLWKRGGGRKATFSPDIPITHGRCPLQYGCFCDSWNTVRTKSASIPQCPHHGKSPRASCLANPPPPLWLSRTLGSLCKRMPAIDIFRHAKHLGWCPAAFVGFSVLGQQTADLTRVVDNVRLSFCVTIDLWGIFSRCLTPLIQGIGNSPCSTRPKRRYYKTNWDLTVLLFKWNCGMMLAMKVSCQWNGCWEMEGKVVDKNWFFLGFPPC